MEKKIESRAINSYIVAYSTKLDELNNQLPELEKAHDEAMDYYEADSLPREEWDSAAEAVNKASKARKDCEEAIDAIEHIIDELKSLQDNVQFLEYLGL